MAELKALGEVRQATFGPLLALSGCANRAGPRLLSVENRKTFARSEPFGF